MNNQDFLRDLRKIQENTTLKEISIDSGVDRQVVRRVFLGASIDKLSYKNGRALVQYVERYFDALQAASSGSN